MMMIMLYFCHMFAVSVYFTFLSGTVDYQQSHLVELRQSSETSNVAKPV